MTDSTHHFHFSCIPSSLCHIFITILPAWFLFLYTKKPISQDPYLDSFCFSRIPCNLYQIFLFTFSPFWMLRENTIDPSHAAFILSALWSYQLLLCKAATTVGGWDHGSQKTRILAVCMFSLNMLGKQRFIPFCNNDRSVLDNVHLLLLFTE